MCLENKQYRLRLELYQIENMLTFYYTTLSLSKKTITSINPCSTNYYDPDFCINYSAG